MRFGVTGGTGFIGSHFVKQLVKQNHEVIVFVDKNLESTHRLKSIIDKINFEKVDLENIKTLKKKIKNFDVIAHFAASASTKTGTVMTDIDLKRGTISTYNVLESMRINKIKKIIFPSAPAIYGNPIKIPTSEETGMLLPVSLYGASKLACEGMISAFCHLFEMNGWVFRLGNVVGPDMTRGVIKDFIDKLSQNSDSLEIFGDGNQQKDIIYIDDCIDGIFFLFKKSNDKINVFNLSSGTMVSVKKIAKIVMEEMNLKDVKIVHRGKEGVGWAGDVPMINYDITKVKNFGWSPKYDAETAVRLSIRKLISNSVT